MTQGTTLNRRQLNLGLAVAAAAGGGGAGFARSPVTAGELVARIRQAIGAGWKDDTSDGFVLGGPDSPASVVAVTVNPTMASLRRAVAQGCTTVISMESPLYARPLPGGAPPDPEQPAGRTAAALRADPTYAAKLAFAADNKLAVYRLNENLRAHRPDLFTGAIGRAMGWAAPPAGAEPGRFDLPPTPLAAIAGTARRRLGLNGGMRVIGDGSMTIRRALVVPGRIDPVAVVRAMPDVDLLLTGDLREWELVEYIWDSRQADRPKALIAVGRIMSEQPGMLAAAAWLRTVLGGARVVPVPVEDPYWRLPA